MSEKLECPHLEYARVRKMYCEDCIAAAEERGRLAAAVVCKCGDELQSGDGAICGACLQPEIAEAEERGRRRGVEERDALRTALRNIVGVWKEIHDDAKRRRMWILGWETWLKVIAEGAALASRDSAPVAAPKVPTPDIDAAWSAQAGVCGLLPATVICSECGPISGAISPAELERLAPRDSAPVCDAVLSSDPFREWRCGKPKDHEGPHAGEAPRDSGKDDAAFAEADALLAKDRK